MATIKIKSSTWVKLNCILTIIVAILLFTVYFQKEPKMTEDVKQEMNSCCGFPCQNGGICIPEDKGYTCDCTDTGYYGKNCHKVLPTEWFKSHIKFNPTKTLSTTSGPYFFFCKTFNYFTLFQNAFNQKLYRATAYWGKANYRWTNSYDFSVVDPYVNVTFSERSLPPIPKTCPAPMGICGPKQLPSLELIYEKLLKRTHFQPCSKGTNLLFATFIQHFVFQFNHFEESSDEQHERSNNIIDMSQVYGKHEPLMSALRSFKQGKLKSRYYRDEEYPPYSEDCADVNMMDSERLQKSYMSRMILHPNSKPNWALGNERLRMSPMLFAISTIWLREHNRICSILAKEHRSWTDEQLYQTAKLIVAGVAIKIMLTEYMNHLLQFQIDIVYNPKLTSTLDLPYTAKIAKEFFILPHWQPLMPDQLTVECKTYNISEVLFTNNYIVFKHGLDQIIHAMALQPAGEMGRNNVGDSFQCCIKHLINESRSLSVQSFNNYRRRFGLKPAETFEEITGNIHTATTLKELYMDVEAVELIVGLLTEQQGSGIAPPTMTTLGGAWLMRGLLSHPINSPEWWKSVTFGGELGMNIIKTASLKKLICFNMKNKCKDIYVDFKILKHSVSTSK